MFDYKNKLTEYQKQIYFIHSSTSSGLNPFSPNLFLLLYPFKSETVGLRLWDGQVGGSSDSDWCSPASGGLLVYIHF